MRASLVALTLCSAAAAQQSVRDDLGRLERRMTEIRGHESELRRALDRQSAGELPDDVRWLKVSDVDRARAAATSTDALAASQAVTEELRAELARLEDAVRDVRRRRAEQAAGDTAPRDEESARLERPAPTPSAASEPRVGRPGSAPAESPAIAPRAAATVIRGSEDRVRIGKVLVESGIQLLREADALEREGRTEVASASRARAREQLEAARVELDGVARAPDRAELSALFALARCEERLGHVADADALFLAIVERDRSTGADGRPITGPFGRSARIARTVMGWIRDTGDWRPRRDVDQIHWDAPDTERSAGRPERR